MIDKNNLINELLNRKTVCLELGCGSIKRYPDSIGIDALDYPEVDIVGDIFEVLRSFPDKVVDRVHASHFIEHVTDIELLMSELSRIVKINGLVEFVAPHFSNPYFYSDPTHRRFFGLYTFCYMTKSSLFSRKVPTYQNIMNFSLDCVELNFKSARPFYFRHAMKLIIGLIFNSCNYLKEMYEENFCYLFPCYEVYYKLIRIDEHVVSV